MPGTGLGAATGPTRPPGQGETETLAPETETLVTDAVFDPPHDASTRATTPHEAIASKRAGRADTATAPACAIG